MCNVIQKTVFDDRKFILYPLKNTCLGYIFSGAFSIRKILGRTGNDGRAINPKEVRQKAVWLRS